ncbi:hypothetical protein Efla_006089 [Eimeria flavescens]
MRRALLWRAPRSSGSSSSSSSWWGAPQGLRGESRRLAAAAVQIDTTRLPEAKTTTFRATATTATAATAATTTTAATAAAAAPTAAAAPSAAAEGSSLPRRRSRWCRLAGQPVNALRNAGKTERRPLRWRMLATPEALQQQQLLLQQELVQHQQQRPQQQQQEEENGETLWLDVEWQTQPHDEFVLPLEADPQGSSSSSSSGGSKGRIRRSGLQQNKKGQQQQRQPESSSDLASVHAASSAKATAAAAATATTSAAASAASEAAAAAGERRRVLQLLRSCASAADFVAFPAAVLAAAAAAAAAEGRPAGRAFKALGALEGALVLQLRQGAPVHPSTLAQAAIAFRTLGIPHVDLLVCSVPSITAAAEEVLSQGAGCTDTPAATAATAVTPAAAPTASTAAGSAAAAAAAAAASRWALPLLEAFAAARLLHEKTRGLLLQLLLLPAALQHLELPQLASLAVCVAAPLLLGGPAGGPSGCPSGGPHPTLLLSLIAERASHIFDLMPRAVSSSSSNSTSSSSSSNSSICMQATGGIRNYGTPLGPLPGRSVSLLLSAFCRVEVQQRQQQQQQPGQQQQQQLQQQQLQQQCASFRTRLLQDLLPVSAHRMTAWELAAAANALMDLAGQLSSSSSSSSSSISSTSSESHSADSLQLERWHGQHQQQQQQQQQQLQHLLADAMRVICVSAGRRLEQFSVKTLTTVVEALGVCGVCPPPAAFACSVVLHLPRLLQSAAAAAAVSLAFRLSACGVTSAAASAHFLTFLQQRHVLMMRTLLRHRHLPELLIEEALVCLRLSPPAAKCFCSLAEGIARCQPASVQVYVHLLQHWQQQQQQREQRQQQRHVAEAHSVQLAAALLLHASPLQLQQLRGTEEFQQLIRQAVQSAAAAANSAAAAAAALERLLGITLDEAPLPAAAPAAAAPLAAAARELCAAETAERAAAALGVAAPSHAAAAAAAVEPESLLRMAAGLACAHYAQRASGCSSGISSKGSRIASRSSSSSGGRSSNSGKSCSRSNSSSSSKSSNGAAMPLALVGDLVERAGGACGESHADWRALQAALQLLADEGACTPQRAEATTPAATTRSLTRERAFTPVEASFGRCLSSSSNSSSCRSSRSSSSSSSRSSTSGSGSSWGPCWMHCEPPGSLSSSSSSSGSREELRELLLLLQDLLLRGAGISAAGQLTAEEAAAAAAGSAAIAAAQTAAAAGTAAAAAAASELAASASFVADCAGLGISGLCVLLPSALWCLDACSSSSSSSSNCAALNICPSSANLKEAVASSCTPSAGATGAAAAAAAAAGGGGLHALFVFLGERHCLVEAPNAELHAGGPCMQPAAAANSRLLQSYLRDVAPPSPMTLLRQQQQQQQHLTPLARLPAISVVAVESLRRMAPSAVTVLIDGKRWKAMGNSDKQQQLQRTLHALFQHPS